MSSYLPRRQVVCCDLYHAQDGRTSLPIYKQFCLNKCMGWLFGLIILLLAVGIFAAYRWRVRNVERQRIELATQVAIQTKELAALHSITAVVSNELELPETLAESLAKTLDVMHVAAGIIFTDMTIHICGRVIEQSEFLILRNFSTNYLTCTPF